MDDFDVTIPALMAMTGYTYGGLTALRYAKLGPDYIKVNHRVFYSRSSIDAWMASRTTRQRTASEQRAINEQIRAARQDGAKYDQISVDLNVSRGTISDALARGGVNIRRRPKADLATKIAAVAYARRHSYSIAARDLGHSRRAIINWSKQAEVQSSTEVSNAAVERGVQVRIRKDMVIPPS